MQTGCRCSHWLCRYSVGVVNNYAATDKTRWTLSENFEGFSQILKEKSGENLKFACPHSRWLRQHAIFDFCNGISLQKWKSSWNSFCLFIWGPGRIFLSKKNGQKSRDNVPLSFRSSICSATGQEWRWTSRVVASDTLHTVLDIQIYCLNKC